MKKILFAGAAGGLAILLSQPSAAAGFLDEITWVPQIGAQVKNLKFEQKFGGGVFEDEKGDVEVDLPSISASLTTIYRKFYLSFKYEQSVGDTSDDSDVPFTYSDTEVDREDYSVTAGYNVWRSANVFVGYMSGKTKLKPSPLCPAFGDSYQGACDADESGTIPQGNIAYQAFFYGEPSYEQTYEEDGWYLGGSYGWKLWDAGTLSVSAAYADLDATYKDNYSPPDANFDFDGNADGFSVGINWSAPISKHVGYYLDIRTQKYDANTDDSNGNFPGASAKSEETITAFTAGVQWYL